MLNDVILSDVCRVKIEDVKVYGFTIPTATSESDGTLEWNKTTIVVVEIFAEGQKGMGYTYADTATAIFIRDNLAIHITASTLWMLSQPIAR